MIILDQLPDKFILSFMRFVEIIPDDFINRMRDYDLIEQPHEFAIYYCFAYLSFFGFVMMILGLKFIVEYSYKSDFSSFKLFFIGLLTCILTGFTTFMPFLI
ncbi:MAG: hypothetical protein GF311_21965 [Candidatus Lokiarchaeota archaeon]|nr:hypothetical protein [Candidatus Lokiarchaeota archaeon]